MVKGRPATIIYKLSRGSEGSTTLSILDELPAELGGDLLIERGAAFASRQRSSLRANESHCGAASMRSVRLSSCGARGWACFAFGRKSPDGGSIAILPASSNAAATGGLTHRSLRDELGIRPRPARGEGSEFESLREYVSGDDPRHVDWHASARRGRLIVRQHQTERHHTVIIAVDTGRLMAARMDGGIEARSRARLRDRAGARVEGIRRSGRVHRVRSRVARCSPGPKAGFSGIGGIVAATLKLEAAPFEPNYRVLAENLARHQKKRALVVVLTDFVEGSASRELEEYLAVLARRHVRGAGGDARSIARRSSTTRSRDHTRAALSQARVAGSGGRARGRARPNRAVRRADARPRSRAHHRAGAESVPGNAAGGASLNSQSRSTAGRRR